MDNTALYCISQNRIVGGLVEVEGNGHIRNSLYCRNLLDLAKLILKKALGYSNALLFPRLHGSGTSKTRLGVVRRFSISAISRSAKFLALVSRPDISIIRFLLRIKNSGRIAASRVVE